MSSVRTVVVPVAGLGTRMLPATKSIPKEMIPVLDRPVIDWVVREALDAGIERIVFVTGRGKAAIEDYFDFAFEVDATLEAKSKATLLEAARDMVQAAGAVSYTRQQSPLGLGHAVWCARDLVGDAPFAIALPDMIFHGKPGCLAEMVRAHDAHGGNLLAVGEVPHADTAKYGIVAPKGDTGAVFEIAGMVEKPKPEDAPSNFAITGRYILEPEIFRVLETTPRGAGGEIQLTDAMEALLKTRPFRATVFRGEVFDCGDRLGWLKANVAMAMENPAYADELRKMVG